MTIKDDFKFALQDAGLFVGSLTADFNEADDTLVLDGAIIMRITHETMTPERQDLSEEERKTVCDRLRQYRCGPSGRVDMSWSALDLYSQALPFKFGQHVIFRGKLYLVFDLDADGEAQPHGCTVVLLDIDKTHLLKGVRVEEVRVR